MGAIFTIVRVRKETETRIISDDEMISVPAWCGADKTEGALQITGKELRSWRSLNERVTKLEAMIQKNCLT
jgi:hypothetical protein